MWIAEKLKEQGICVYLLYMWQVEDILRGFGLDEETIETRYVSRFPAEDREEEMQWLQSLIDMMKEEGVQEKGHLQMNNNVLLALEDLHHELLNSPRHAEYTAAYYKALPCIVQLRAKGNQDKHEVEVGLEAIYLHSIMRMQKKQFSKETERGLRYITALLQMLSDAYAQDKKGELEL